MAKSRKRVNHPWVMTALICEGLLEEKDGVFSAIRIIDQFNLPRPPEWDGKTNLHIPMIIFLGFKAGDVKGSRTVRLYHTSPKGKRKKMFEQKIEFLGGHFGNNLRLNTTFGFKTEGTHWIDVYVERWLATRMPITIVFVEPTKNLQEESPADQQ